MFSRNSSQLSHKLFGNSSVCFSRPFCTIHAQMCFYDILGIKSSANASEIKKAYYAKVKKYHPDHNKTSSAEENFKIIARAYEVLKDPTSREQYDNTKNTNRQGSSGFNSEGFSNSKASSGFSSSGRSYSSYSNPYTSYSGRTYGHQEAWDHFNKKREEQEQAKRRRNATRAENHSSPSIFENLVVRIGLIAAFVYFFDYYLTDYKNQQRSVFQAESLAFTEPRKEFNERELNERKDISEEMKSKNFRIEYHKAPIVVSAEAAEAIKTYKKEKKVVGLDVWVEKQNFRLHKSEDRFAVN